ncbi:ribbon-helix-helix domain-containing protein [Pseudaestuariivita sp.]|uniref:ribbon-helix-helix domain-containing protein n=1 Tax=Pseudaestuariivita sp. TaxID=2211669 RepID=UPI004059D649
MSARPVKRSLTLKGHRTSVSLEDPFWQEFRRIAAAKGKPINALAAEIDAARDLETGLASAIRLYVLAHLKNETSREGPSSLV